MDREVVGARLAYSRRHYFDDPEGEGDFRNFIQHGGEAPVMRTIQDQPSLILQIVRRPDRYMRLAAVRMLDGRRLLPRGCHVGSSQSKICRNPSAQTLSPETPQRNDVAHETRRGRLSYSSTCDFNRASASSHCLDTRSR